MALKLGLNLGYWGIGPQGDEAVEIVQAAERAGYDSVWAAESYGSDAVSVLAYLAAKTETIQLGAAILQVPARPPGRGRDGGRHDRRPLGRPLHLRLRPLRPAGLRGLVRRPLRQALGPHPRVRRDRQGDRRPRGPARVRGQALHAAAEGGRGRHRPGQGAEAQHPPGPQRDPDLPRRDRPQVGRARRGDRRRLDPDLLLGRRVGGGLGRAHRGGPRQGRPLARGLRRSRPRSRSRSTATSTPPAAWSRRGCCSTSAAWAPRRRTSTSTSPAASASREVADEVQSLYLDGKREEAYAAIPDELVDATAMIGTEDEVAERVKRFADAGRRPA